MLCALAASAAQAQTPPAPATPAAPAAAPAPVVVGSATPGPAAEQLIVTDTRIGTGKEATTGATVFMHYSGWLYRPLAKNMHGKLFDSSLPRGEPLDFVLGAGRVIKGWDQGIQGMKVGGKRTLIIPSELAYGSRPAAGSNIPPNSALIFDVELMDVK
jgi:FKBP-type peptidyl-prolyl cis-trans isomerase FkpA